MNEALWDGLHHSAVLRSKMKKKRAVLEGEKGQCQEAK
jgi:hypothetical protein